MSEPKTPPPIAPLSPPAHVVAKPNVSAAVVHQNSKPAQVAPVGVKVDDSPARFGGHKGGGKKRQDGLLAGSPEAIAADKKKDAERKASSRAQAKVAGVPPPIPSVAVSAGSAPVPMAGGSPAPAGSPVPSNIIPFPTFVPWQEKVVGRIIARITKIADRFRCSSLMKRVRRLGLNKEDENKIEGQMRYKDEVISDFNNAVTVCVTTELNKHQVPGAEHSHYLDVLVCGTELVTHHMDTVDMLEKMILKNEEMKKLAPAPATTQAPPLAKAA